jgi:hypothetical protein
MSWTIVEKEQAAIWNERLQSTKAPFSQYPYYTSAENSFRLSKVIFLVFSRNGQDIAFASITEIGLYPFKTAILEGGPVPLVNNANEHNLIEQLKDFARRRKYLHLQVRPFNLEQECFFRKDNDFQQRLFFPFHQKEENEYNIYNQPEPQLHAALKGQCRRKIVLAARMPYQFGKLEKEEDLKEVFTLFKKAARDKHYYFMPFQAFREMFISGKRYNLCDIYTARLNSDIINAVLIVKDAMSYYHLASAMEIKGFKENESPAAKLHYFLMQDCFYSDQREFYNISYGGSDNLLRFKNLFNPVLVAKPRYYTFIVNRGLLNILKKISPESTTSIRSVVKRIVGWISGLTK